MNILCRLGFHKWGYEHWGIQICQQPDCTKIDTHRGFWGAKRFLAEKHGARILTDSAARTHWNDLESRRLEGLTDCHK